MTTVAIMYYIMCIWANACLPSYSLHLWSQAEPVQPALQTQRLPVHLPFTHLEHPSVVIRSSHFSLKSSSHRTRIAGTQLYKNLLEHVDPVHPESHVHWFGPVHLPCTQLGLQITGITWKVRGWLFHMLWITLMIAFSFNDALMDYVLCLCLCSTGLVTDKHFWYYW